VKDFVIIGSCPYGEDCAQVGQLNYSEVTKVEIAEFKRMVIEKFPQLNRADCKVKLTVKANGHDFGTYHELAAIFDDDDEDASDLAYDVESHGIEEWDEMAKDVLRPLYQSHGRASKRENDFIADYV